MPALFIRIGMLCKLWGLFSAVDLLPYLGIMGGQKDVGVRGTSEELIANSDVVISVVEGLGVRSGALPDVRDGRFTSDLSD